MTVVFSLETFDDLTLKTGKASANCEAFPDPYNGGWRQNKH